MIELCVNGPFIHFVSFFNSRMYSSIINCNILTSSGNFIEITVVLSTGFNPFSLGTAFASESNNCRRQILMYKDCPRTKRVKIMMAVGILFLWYIIHKLISFLDIHFLIYFEYIEVR